MEEAPANPHQEPFESTAELLSLVEAFEKGNLVPSDWNHRTRLAVAIVYVLLDSCDHARQRLRAVLPTFNRELGIDDPTLAWHETLVTVYLRAIDAALGESRSDDLVDSANQLLSGPLGDPRFVTEFYSPERLWSAEARDHFIAPDRRPLPAA